MKKIMMLSLLLTACGQFHAKNEGGPGPTLHTDPAIIQAEQQFVLSSGMETVKTTPFLRMLMSKAYAADAQQAVTSVLISATAAPGVTFTATFTPSSPNIDVTTSQVKLGTFTITALNDNSVRKCGNTAGTLGTKQCNRAYIRMFTANNGLLGSGDAPDTAPVLSGNPLTDISSATSVAPALLKTANITSNRFRLSQLGTDTSYEVWADFSEVGDGSYSTTVTLQYAIGKQ